MSIQPVTSQFTMKELAYFLFKKKVCPKCGGQMRKKRCFKIVDGSLFNTNDVPLYIQGSRNVKNYFYTYTCKECGAEYPLSELVN